MNNLMIDIETLGTKPGCPILAIAVVPFACSDSEDIGRVFYAKISQESCTEAGLVSDAATLAWWGKQSVAARAEAFSGKEHIKEVLLDLYDYYKSFDIVPQVWGNGASFDVPIIEAAYSVMGMAAPWKYYNSMCYRTLKNLYHQVPFIEPKIKHSAMEDATAQANHADRIFQFAKLGIYRHATSA